jgi:hypothetical protein
LHPELTETVRGSDLLAIQIIFILVPLSALHVLKPQRPPREAGLPLPIHPMSRALVPARVVEQVVLVVPFGIVPLPEGCELGDDRPSLEAINRGGHSVSKGVYDMEGLMGVDVLFLLDLGGDLLSDLFLLRRSVEQGRSVLYQPKQQNQHKNQLHCLLARRQQLGLTAPPIRSLPINGRRVMRPKEELDEFSVPDRTGLPGHLDGFGVPGVS